MRETTIENRFTNEIQKRGGIAAKFTSPGMSGVPDRVALLPGGRIVFVELKAPGKKMEPLQAYRSQQIKSLGFKFYCLDSHTAIDNFLQEVFA